MKTKQIGGFRKALGVAVLVGLTVAGCAKKRDYKQVGKEEVQSKDTAFDPSAEYVYVPSMLEAPMTVDATMPGYQGTERLVKFRFTEKSMLAESVETDDRFKNNPANAKPVMEIPVEYFDYRCADNGNGECSNHEEVVDDKDWASKRFFRPDINSIKVQETNTLPMELENLFHACQTEVGSRVVSYKFERDDLNIELEKTFKVSGECLEIRELEEIPEATTFNVRYHYSFARRDTVVTKGYTPVYYPQTDENTFGFFKTELRTLSNDNRDQEDGVLPLMDRWDPNRTSIKYYLSANFAKPEYKRVLEATKESVAAVNDGLKRAGVNFQIDLQPPSDVAVGDIRTSMLYMVEDPQASGIIGYGPTAHDPRTGEILSGRVVLYLGSMKKFLRQTWDEMAAIEQAKIAAAKTQDATRQQADAVKTGSAPLSTVGGTGMILAHEAGETGSHMDAIGPFLKSYSEHKADYVAPGAAGANLTKSLRDSRVLGGGIRALLGGKSFERYKRSMYAMRDSSLSDMKANRSFVDRDDSQKSKNFLRQRTELLAKYAYPADYLNAQTAIKNATLKELKTMPMVPWDQLTEAQQDKVLDVTLPYIWVSTLVHELGHNMGLRHNFAGSEDKDNFYSSNELKGLGRDDSGEEAPVIYSSVMDYSKTELNFLHVMGKYDVAALRFGYRREVETKDGKIAKVAGSLEQMDAKAQGQFLDSMKSYSYCTDENTGINPNCRRFDEGTTLTDIAKTLQSSYADRYWRSNFRNGRRSFSELDDPAYVSAIDDLMSDMRPFFERYDQIWKQIGGDPEKDPQFQTDDAASFRKYYLDLKDAVKIVRDTYVKTILTPGAGCLVQFIDGENKGKVTTASAKALGGTFKSCFDPSMLSLLMANSAVPVAQYGKNFINEKSRTSTNPYADQIDTRGIWGDKLLAVDYLVQRRLGVKTFDDYRGNFLDMTTFSAPVIDPTTGKPLLDAKKQPVMMDHTFDEKMVEIIDGFLMNDLTLGKKDRLAEEGLPEMDLVMSDGSVAPLKQEFNYYPASLHWIPMANSRGLRRYFWLPDDDVSFGEMMLSRVLGKVEDTTPSPIARSLKDYYGLKAALSNTDDPKTFASYDLGDMTVYADQQKNTFAMNVINQITVVKTLDRVKDDRMDAVIAAAKQREAKEDAKKNGKPTLEFDNKELVVTAPATMKDGKMVPPKTELKDKPSGLSPDEETAAKLPSAVIQSYRDGKFDGVPYYELVLRMVERANVRAKAATNATQF